jgi:trk system potassium uptake protein TrkH
MATGGFSTRNASIGAFQSTYIDYVIIIFMILAGTNFALHYRLLHGSIKEVLKNSEFRFYIGIIIFSTIFIGIQNYLYHYTNFFETLHYTLFQVVSIMTTTGYGTYDYEQWSYSSQLMLLLLMYIGGCAGSTGGGIKVIRIYILIKYVYSEIIRLLHPQAVIPIRIGDAVVDRKVVTNIAGFFILFLVVTVIGVISMSLVGLDIHTSIGAVSATINNIGPGIGLVGPTENYGHIPIQGKWILSFLMLIGRLEVFTVLIMLAPSFWRK